MTFAWLLVAFCLPTSCRSKEEERHAPRRPSDSNGNGGGVKPIFGNCPFGICGGGGGSSGSDDPTTICERMRDLSKTAGGTAIKPGELEKCEEELTKMQKKEPAQYAAMASCANSSETMDKFMSCFMAALMPDAGAPLKK